MSLHASNACPLPTTTSQTNPDTAERRDPRHRFVFMAAVCLWATRALIVGTAPLGAEEAALQPVHVRLVADHQRVAPGQSFRLGIAFEIDDEWHLYWDGTNDTGFPILIEPVFPDGFEAGEVQWPAPRRHVSPGRILDHVYEEQVTLLLPVTVSESARPGSEARLRCALTWAVCRDVCIVGQDTVEVVLPITAGLPHPASEEDFALFEQTLLRLPGALPVSDPEIEMRWHGDDLRIQVQRASSLAFFPGAECGMLVDAIVDGVASGDNMTIRFRHDVTGIGPAAGIMEATRPEYERPRYYSIRLLHPDGGKQ